MSQQQQSKLFFTSFNKVQSLTDKRSSCENEISTIICLVYRSSPSVPRTRRIWLYRRTRQKERGNQQSIKSEKFFRKILVSLWLHIDGALSITIYNNEQILIFCRNHAFIYILLFPEKSDQLSTKFVRSCTEIGLLPGDGAERRLRANRKQVREFIVL